MTTDDLRTRARGAAEEAYRKPRWHVGTITDRLIEAFYEGYLAHAAQQPSRDAIRDELAHWPIGYGYESASVSIDDAGDMADAILALFDGADRD